jgi:peptidyl-prolyl cis-trans isomerase SurA
MTKKIYLFLLSSCLLNGIVNAQTLFTYGNNQVSKQEFLRAYNKNKTAVTDKQQALKDYLELYGKFKLKVQAAKEMKLDTLQQLNYDLQNFRTQVEEGYLNDDKGIDALLDEAIARSQKDIHLLHFYVALSNKMPAADTVKAHKAMEEVREELIKGKTDYDELVNEITAEFLPIKGSDLGFITALQIPYTFENIAYSLKPGGVSKVIRTKTGLHIFKNEEEKPSAGRWKVAQILLAIPPEVDGVTLKKAEKLADSIYNTLKAGADFAETAKRLSDDKLTYMIGGEMPEFGTGKFDLPFEKAIFSLKNDGDITKPIFTRYGFHIVKRLQQKPTPIGRSDDNFVYTLKQQLLQDARVEIPKANFTKQVLVKTGFKKNTAIKENDLFAFADSVSENKIVGNYPINKKTIFSFAKLNVIGSDWLNFVKDYKLNNDVYKGETNKELYAKYINTAAIEYYRKHLEEFNDDFKYQMQEFKEGNMLFEAMERNVWSLAASDSIGLVKFYATNRQQYKWAESATIILFNCNSEKSANEAIAALQNGKNWKAIADASEGNLQADSGRYEITQIQLPPNTTLKEGLVTTPLLSTTDNTASFIKVLQTHPANTLRSFEEAKGLVINDYQNYLEEQWIAALKKKNPIKVNETVFKSLVD